MYAMKLSALTLANLAAASVLLLTPFLVGVTASAPYDPWSDLDADGDIDIFDLVKIAGSYATTGDPGKNVTVTNWPLVQNTNVTNLPPVLTSHLAYSTVTNVTAYSGFSTDIVVDGYSKVTVCLYTNAFENIYSVITYRSGGSIVFEVDYQSNVPSFLVKTYDVPNQVMQFRFANNDPVTRTLAIDVYVIA